jgi:uncharacterized protein YlbG (UPF0298 family)
MINYKIVNKKNKFCVLETQTDQIVKVCDTVQKAKKYVKHLNLGGGFDGWSPSFIQVKI